MLIHETHASSGGRISQDLLATYVRYKQDTRAIIAWLISHGTQKYKSLNTISIKDMFSLAETVQRKAVAMPDLIDFHFRGAIAARTEISRHFRQNDKADIHNQENTLNHEYFTTSLTQIYTGLCECCGKAEAVCKNTQKKHSVNGNKTEPTNRFEILNLGPHDVDCSLRGVSPNGKGKRDTATTSSTPTKVKSCPQLVDPLSDMFELQKEAQEMDNLLLATTNVWEQASRQSIPIVMAAFVTNAAFAIFEGVEQRLKILCNGSDPAILQTKFVQMREELKSDGNDDGVSCIFGSSQVEALQSPWNLLIHLKNSSPVKAQEKSVSKCTSQITVRRGPNSAPIDRECYSTIIGNITRHVRADRRPTSIVLGSTPLFADVGYFMTHEENNTNGLRCALGLQIILEAHKSYLLASQCTHAPSNCRLQALKFAQEVAANLGPILDDSSMPCRCCQTLASHLEGFKLDLEAFFQENVFDLYFQSPWVSGCHVLEMLESSFYFGLRLFSYRHYCGSVLHVYNILRRLTGFQKVDVLDQLCDIFNEVLFPGGRPDRNFKACCMRYMGGRLRFNAQTPNHRSGSHKMEIPVHSAKATAGFGLRKEANDSRFQYRKISLLHHIKHDKGYHLDDALWSRVHSLAGGDGDQTMEKAKKRRSCPNHGRRGQRHLVDSTQHQLCELQEAAMTEFTGPFPIAKINFFKVYIACIRIVGIISNHAHEEEDQGSRCLCFLDTILSAADRYRDNEHKMQPFGCKGLRQGCEKAIVTVLGDVSLDDFLWENL